MELTCKHEASPKSHTHIYVVLIFIVVVIMLWLFYVSVVTLCVLN